ncbi:MAG: multiheme c-type cytochrome [Thermoguttaceae bacterium]
MFRYFVICSLLFLFTTHFLWSDTATNLSQNTQNSEELFADWPEDKLKVLLLFTGFLKGYVEPCGCAGLENMKGGLSRRHTFFKQLAKKNWPVLAIDAGNLNKGFGRQEEIKFNLVIDEALRLMDYKAVGIGDHELLLPTDELLLYTVDVPGNPQRYTSANVAILDFDPSCTMPFRILEQNGVSIGVTSVIAPSLLANLNNNDIQHDEAESKLKAVLEDEAMQKADYRVLIIHGNDSEIENLINTFSKSFDFILPSNTPAEPPIHPEKKGETLLVEVGEKGRFAVAIGIFDDAKMPIRYLRIPIDNRFDNSKEIDVMMQLYQEQLAQIGLSGLGIKPIPDSRSHTLGKFVGSKTCADCHEESYKTWKKSPHSDAWKSLSDISIPSRTNDPECIACHVDGWSVRDLLPYQHGFLDITTTPHLSNVGCESCHGPGENHVKAEQGSDKKLQEEFRRAARLTVENGAAKKRCIECHDGDNSPHFDFETYWNKVIHKETAK